MSTDRESSRYSTMSGTGSPAAKSVWIASTSPARPPDASLILSGRIAGGAARAGGHFSRRRRPRRHPRRDRGASRHLHHGQYQRQSCDPGCPRTLRQERQAGSYLPVPTSRTKIKKTVIAHRSTGTNNYGYWTGTADFSGQEAGAWRIGKVRVLGISIGCCGARPSPRTPRPCSSSTTAKWQWCANGRTQGPESARTTKFALRVHSDNDDYPYQNVPVRLSAEFRRPSGKTFLRRIETRTNEKGKSVVTFGPYHMARVRTLSIELPDPGGGSFVVFFDLR